MTEFEASAEPLQDWLNNTEVRVQESSARLHDLPAKKEELSKLQVLHRELVCVVLLTTEFVILYRIPHC